jgi:hypothetical protein
MQTLFVNFGKVLNNNNNMKLVKRVFYFIVFILITGSSIIPILIFFSSFKLNDDLKDRTPVRLLKDAESKKIDWTPKTVSISYLSAFVQNYPKEKSFNKNIRFGYEFNCYEVNCLVKSYTIDDEGDYSLILADIRDTSKTIKAELVNPENSQAKKSDFVNSFSQTIIEFNKYLKKDSTLSYASFNVIGVAFFNSNNKIELSPLMDFQIKEKLR